MALDDKRVARVAFGHTLITFREKLTLIGFGSAPRDDAVRGSWRAT